MLRLCSQLRQKFVELTRRKSGLIADPSQGHHYHPRTQRYIQVASDALSPSHHPFAGTARDERPAKAALAGTPSSEVVRVTVQIRISPSMIGYTGAIIPLKRAVFICRSSASRPVYCSLNDFLSVEALEGLVDFKAALPTGVLQQVHHECTQDGWLSGLRLSMRKNS
jgi:hypothetical protein